MKKFGVLFSMLCMVFGSLITASEVFASKHVGAFTMSVPFDSQIFYEKAKGNSQRGLSLGWGIPLFRSDNIKFYFGSTTLEFSLTPKTADIIHPESATFVSVDVGAIFYPTDLPELSILFALSRGYGNINLINSSTGLNTKVTYYAYGLKLGFAVEIYDGLAIFFGAQTIGDGGLGGRHFDADGIRARIYFLGFKVTR